MTYADTFLVPRMEVREREPLCLCEVMGLFPSRGELLFSAAGFEVNRIDSQFRIMINLGLKTPLIAVLDFLTENFIPVAQGHAGRTGKPSW